MSFLQRQNVHKQQIRGEGGLFGTYPLMSVKISVSALLRFVGYFTVGPRRSMMTGVRRFRKSGNAVGARLAATANLFTRASGEKCATGRSRIYSRTRSNCRVTSLHNWSHGFFSRHARASSFHFLQASNINVRQKG